MEFELCGRCAHSKQDHHLHRDCADCTAYFRECNLCSCSQYATREEVKNRTYEENWRYYNIQRSTMHEFRVTFGWNQPHGPSPEDPYGHYSTIWAHSPMEATEMAMRRYDGKFAFVYHPPDWKLWGDMMAGCKQLEQLQYYRNSMLQPYPDRGHIWGEVILGSP